MKIGDPVAPGRITALQPITIDDSAKTITATADWVEGDALADMVLDKPGVTITNLGRLRVVPVAHDAAVRVTDDSGDQHYLARFAAENDQ